MSDPVQTQKDDDLITPSTAPLREWIQVVAKDWRLHWRGRDHRYGRDFAAFVGERLMTDFRLREFEEKAR